MNWAYCQAGFWHSYCTIYLANDKCKKLESAEVRTWQLPRLRIVDKESFIGEEVIIYSHCIVRMNIGV